MRKNKNEDDYSEFDKMFKKNFSGLEFETNFDKLNDILKDQASHHINEITVSSLFALIVRPDMSKKEKEAFYSYRDYFVSALDIFSKHNIGPDVSIEILADLIKMIMEKSNG